MNNVTMERTLSALQISFYLISSVFVQYVKKDAFLVNQVTSQALQWSSFRRNKIFYLHMTESMERFVFQMDEYMIKQHLKSFK